MFKKVISAVSKISKAMNWCSMALVFIVAVIMFLDIIVRLVSDASILGTYEITEMGMTVIIFGALAQTQFLKGHVRVTMLIEKLPPKVERVFEGFFLLATTVVAGFVSHASWVQAGVYLNKKATTGVLRMPYYPFAYIMAIGFSIFTLVLLLDTLTSFSKKLGGTDALEDIA